MLVARLFVALPLLKVGLTRITKSGTFAFRIDDETLHFIYIQFDIIGQRDNVS